MSKYMKKLLIIIIIIMSLVISGCSFKEDKNESNTNNSTEENRLKTLSFSELKEKINNKESFILVVGQTTCSHCAEYRPIIKSVLDKYNIVAYEIELDKLSSEEKGMMNDIANVSGTPTTIFIENGTEKTTTNRLVGPASQSKIISRLKSLGYIKE